MTRSGAIVFRWGAPVRGRELQGLAVFGEALQYYEGLTKEGRVIAHREYFSTAGNGGFMLIEGLLPELHQLVQEDEFVKLQAKAAAIVQDFTTDICVGGSDQSVQESVSLYTEALAELGIT